MKFLINSFIASSMQANELCETTTEWTGNSKEFKKLLNKHRLECNDDRDRNPRCYR